MTLSAAQASCLVGLGLALLIAAGTWVLGVVFFAVFDGGEDDVADVQRFVALTEEARGLVPPDCRFSTLTRRRRRRKRSSAFGPRRTRRAGTVGVARPPRRHASNLGRRGTACPSARNSELRPPHPRASTTRTPDPGAASE